MTATSTPDYEALDLAGLCNTGVDALADGPRPLTGDQLFHGLPFRIGDPGKPEAPCFVLIEPGEAVTVNVARPTQRVIFAHRRMPGQHDGDVSVGQVVAQYTFEIAAPAEPARATRSGSGSRSRAGAVTLGG